MDPACGINPELTKTFRGRALGAPAARHLSRTTPSSPLIVSLVRLPMVFNLRLHQRHEEGLRQAAGSSWNQRKSACQQGSSCCTMALPCDDSGKARLNSQTICKTPPKLGDALVASCGFHGLGCGQERRQGCTQQAQEHTAPGPIVPLIAHNWSAQPCYKCRQGRQSYATGHWMHHEDACACLHLHAMPCPMHQAMHTSNWVHLSSYFMFYTSCCVHRSPGS